MSSSDEEAFFQRFDSLTAFFLYVLQGIQALRQLWLIRHNTADAGSNILVQRRFFWYF